MREGEDDVGMVWDRRGRRAGPRRITRLMAGEARLAGCWLLARRVELCPKDAAITGKGSSVNCKREEAFAATALGECLSWR